MIILKSASTIGNARASSSWHAHAMPRRGVGRRGTPFRSPSACGERFSAPAAVTLLVSLAACFSCSCVCLVQPSGTPQSVEGHLLSRCEGFVFQFASWQTSVGETVWVIVSWFDGPTLRERPKSHTSDSPDLPAFSSSAAEAETGERFGSIGGGGFNVKR